jgi:hypothetical protein
MDTSPEAVPGTRLETGCNSTLESHIYAAVPRVNDRCGTAFFDSAESCLHSLAIDEAIQLYKMAEQAGYDPDICAGGRWICHMLRGRFETAWQESDAIAARGNPDRHRFWDGQPFEGRRVLIRCLHGLGDTIQYIRYARLIRERARSLTIEAQPALKSLLAQSQLADGVITWGEPEPFWDQQIEIVELPRIFRTTLETIPHNIPYLRARRPPARAQQNGIERLRIGVVWASSTYNPARSIPFNRFARLFEATGASFFSLQAGEERAQLARWSQTVEDWQTDSACVVATAEKLNALDLLITVDTMIAHLAGALGRPVWTLLPFQCDWRWMLAREDSPWYPTMRLFRQPRPGDWDRVIAQVIEAVHQLTG